MRHTASRKSQAASRFATIPTVEIPRSTFDRSSGHSTTFDPGWLVPIFVDEALPGDTLKLKMDSFIRMATPLKPLMDNLYLDTFFFAVPNRLLWDNWERFNGAQDNPGDSTDFMVPISTSPGAGYAAQSLQDYMGIPPLIGNLQHTTLHMRAYNLIWNEWFRDQNLQDSLTVDTGNGPDDPANYTLRRRGKRHDYFTASLTQPQKGPAVPLPLAGTAPLTANPNVGIGGAPAFAAGVNAGNLQVDFNVAAGENVGFTNGVGAGIVPLTWSNPNLTIDNSNVFADLSSATAATINSIRLAFQIQRLYERDARGGTRYTEIIRSHFRVISDDARMQRPEYLGGSSHPINVHPVAATLNSPLASLGDLAGFITGGGPMQGFTKSFTEHCVVIGLAMVRADLRYQQGLHRMFSRRTRFDFFWPAFAHLGEQEVRSREIYADGSAADDDVFGYQERAAEYRYKPSIITGKFRSNDPQTLDVWHAAQDFAARPLLNASFIEENPPLFRVVATPLEPIFLADFWFTQIHVRPMPTYSVPGLVDHF